MQDLNTWKNFDPEASYMHVCVNETVNGFEITEENFPWERVPKDMVIVADASSNIATRKINYDRFGVIYGGCQKNLGPAGATFVIIRNDLFGKADADVPIMCDWKAHLQA